jgi:uncharacterized protein YegP (UPF0339 family)
MRTAAVACVLIAILAVGFAASSKPDAGAKAKSKPDKPSGGKAAEARAPHFLISKSGVAKDQKWHFTVVASNGEKCVSDAGARFTRIRLCAHEGSCCTAHRLGQSEMYENEAGATNGIESLVEWAKGKENADVKAAKEAGKFHFTIKAKNNKVLRHC